jgi:Glycosyltransferase family 87
VFPVNDRCLQRRRALVGLGRLIMDKSTATLAPAETTVRLGLDGRWWAAAMIAAYILMLVLASNLIGKPRALSLAGALQMSEHFADLSLFAAARQELDRGGNPYLKNPDDPWGRMFNYPKLWLEFMRFPRSCVPAVGFGLILAFLLGIGCWWGRLSPRQGLLAGAALCSPPLVLAMERGNSDLIVLLLLIASLAAFHREARVGAWLGVFLAFVLKLYPVAMIVIFLRLGWRRAALCLAFTGVVVASYLVWRQDEIRTVLHHTPADVLMSYGSTHWPKLAEHWALAATGHHYSFRQFETHSMLWAGALFLGSVWGGWSRRKTAPHLAEGYALDGFRAGASIYALTFIAGSSYVYREVFLVLCLPWLWQSAPAVPAHETARKLTLGLLFAALWLNQYWWIPLMAASDLASWGLLAALGRLLGATLPPGKNAATPDLRPA